MLISLTTCLLPYVLEILLINKPFSKILNLSVFLLQFFFSFHRIQRQSQGQWLAKKRRRGRRKEKEDDETKTKTEGNKNTYKQLPTSMWGSWVTLSPEPPLTAAQLNPRTESYRRSEEEGNRKSKVRRPR